MLEGQNVSKAMLDQPIPPIYILSLKDLPRHHKLSAQLSARDIPFEIVWGIDGREGLPREYEECIDRDAAHFRLGRPLSDAEFACAISHRSIHAKIAHSKAPCAIVLEDDAIIGEAFFDLLPKLTIPLCDLLLMAHRNTYVRSWQKLTLAKTQVAYRIARPPFLATGYMLSREGAEYLSFKTGPISHPADWPESIMNLTTYACATQLVDHPPKASGSSTLEQARQKFQRRRPPSRRFKSLSYWRRWFSKRLATKIA